MKKTKKSIAVISLLFTALLYANAAFAEAPALIDSDFELAADETWPAGWPKIEQSSLQKENENSYLQIQSTTPGELIMLYREVNIPAGTEALELSWKQRVTGLERGENSWFDVRILMEFMDGDRQKLSVKPPTPNVGKDTQGWEEKSVTFNVPEDAKILKFMPSLFRVNAGTLDLDDVVLRPVAKN